MTNHDNARATVERYANAWSSDDFDGIFASYADDFTIHYFGNNPFTGSHVGKEASIETLMAVGALAPRQLVAIDHVLDGDGAAALVVREDITVDGEVHRIGRLLRFRVENDLLAECWLYEENQTLIDAAWSG